MVDAVHEPIDDEQAQMHICPPADFCGFGQSTGAQEWHIVSLLGDVTSYTTVAHYVSMTSDLRVLSTEKH